MESETFSLSGAIERADGGLISSEEMEAFMDAFIELVEAHGYGFGGGYKLNPRDADYELGDDD